MADKSAPVILEGLSRALAEPAGVPLFGQKTTPGLFAGNATSRQAAQHCLNLDLLRVVGTEANGKKAKEIVAITPKGVEHLMSHSEAHQVLLDFVKALEGRDKQLADVIDASRQAQASLDAMRSLAKSVVQRVERKPRAMAEKEPNRRPM